MQQSTPTNPSAFRRQSPLFLDTSAPRNATHLPAIPEYSIENSLNNRRPGSLTLDSRPTLRVDTQMTRSHNDIERAIFNSPLYQPRNQQQRITFQNQTYEPEFEFRPTRRIEEEKEADQDHHIDNEDQDYLEDAENDDGRQEGKCVGSLNSLDELVENHVHDNAFRSTRGSLNDQPNSLIVISHDDQGDRPNENHIEIGTGSRSDLEDTQEGLSSTEAALRNEMIINANYNSKFRGLIALLLCTFVGSFFVPTLSTEYPSQRALFVTIYIGLGYHLLERLSRVFAAHIHRFSKTEDFFKAVDVACLLFFTAILDAYLSDGFEVTKVVVVPSLFLTLIYYCASYAPHATREPECAAKVFLSLQALLITLKLDGDVEWSWKIILGPMWLYLGMVIFYFSLLAVIFVIMTVSHLFGRRVYESIDLRTQFIGHLWHVFYVGLGPLVFTGLLTTVFSVENGSSYKTPRICLQLIRYYSLFLVAFIVANRGHIFNFLKKINNRDELAVEVTESQPAEKRLATVEVEQNMLHLVKVSSTYFLPLKDSFNVKDKSHLKKLKESMKEARNDKFKSEYVKKRSTEKRKISASKIITRDELRQEKQELEKKLQNLERSPFSPIDLEKPMLQRPENEACLDLRNVKNRYISEVVDMDIFEKSAGLKHKGNACHSDGDPETDANAFDDDVEGGLCYICVEKPCNAVIMKCGHGGICYDCAMEFVKKRGQCMECRQDVEKVVKISPDPKLKNIIKGYEAAKLIFT